MLALDARTGKHLWHFQTVHHDLWDYDPAAAPQLVTVKHEGKTVDAVALASKNGFLYVFDRVTGKPLWPIEERPVPQSDVPGEVDLAHAAFPHRSASFFPPGHDGEGYVRRLHDGRGEGVVEGTAYQRAHRHVYAARVGRHDPDAQRQWRRAVLQLPARTLPTGTVYVLGKDMPSIIKLVPAGESTASNSGGLIPDRPRSGRGGAADAPVTAERRGRTVYEQNCQVCHGPDLKGDRGPRIDNAVSRLGGDATRDSDREGQGRNAAVCFADSALSSTI